MKSLVRRKPARRRPMDSETVRFHSSISEYVDSPIIPAVLLVCISKGGFGSAFGSVGVPLMALAIPPVQAAAIMLLVLCLTDLVGFRVRSTREKSNDRMTMRREALIGLGVAQE